jgi:hypothetical protein
MYSLTSIRRRPWSWLCIEDYKLNATGSGISRNVGRSIRDVMTGVSELRSTVREREAALCNCRTQ